MAFEFIKKRSNQEKQSPEQPSGNNNNNNNNIKEKDVNENKSNDLDLIIKKFDEVSLEFKALGCGVHNNKYYFAIHGDPKNIFIASSDKKIYYDELKNPKGEKQIQNKFGIRYKHPFVDEVIKKKWSNQSIKKWLKEDIQIEIKELFFEIKSIFKKYIDHPDDRIINYFVTDVFCTYFMPLYESKGRTVLFAPPASGKTRTLTIFSLLCFNASVMDKSSSLAVMYRYVAGCNGTIIRDNMDREGDSIKEFLNFIEVGYKKDTGTIKCTSKNFELKYYETFAHVIYANIAGLSDSTTISRCNLIELQKTDNKEITKNEIDSDDPIWQDLKDKLYIFAMNEWKTIKKAYNTFEEDNFFSRDLEKLKANLVIAKLVDYQIYKNLVECFKEIEETQKIQDFFENKLFYACEYLDLMLNESNTKTIKFTIKEMVNYMVKKGLILKENKQNTSQYLGRIFSNHSRMFQRGYKEKNVAYTCNQDSFTKFVKDQGFEKIFEKANNSSEASEDNIGEIDTFDLS